MDFLKFHPRFSGNRDSGANLKKVLALVLAFACAFTMFAGAAFTDQADIKVDADVVDTLVSLGIVEGFEDGSFQPNGTVTRAQMAKMIYVLRTGNSDASAYNDDKTSFTDINGHWARGYIKYCQSLGIIAGKSSTIFAPNATVTAQEAAKMLLVTLGYDANKAGLVGPGWAAKTNALADENGLLDDVNTSFTGPCPRQYAAQLIYNAIDAKTVVWRDDAYTNENAAGKDNKTIGEKYMGMYKNTGILKSVKEDSKGKFSVEIAANVAGGVKSDDYDSNYKHSFTKVTKDYTDLLGQEVKVLYKDSDDVFGVYATDKNGVAGKTTVGLLDTLKSVDKTFEVDGDKVKYNASDLKVVTADGENTGKTVAQLMCNGGYNTASTVYLTSVNDDDKIDYAVVIPAQVAKVTYAGSGSITLDHSIGSIDADDVTTYEGIAKKDWVLYTAEENGTAYKDTVVKVQTVTGTVDAIKKGNEIKIGGTYYKQGTGATAPKSGDNVTAVVYGGYYYDIDKNANGASKDDILFVYEAGKLTQGVSSGVEASVLFADGTSKTITIDNLIDPTNDDEYTIANDESIKLATDDDADKYYFSNEKWNSSTKAATLVVGAMYTYELDGSKYDLTPLKNSDNDCGYDNYTGKTTAYTGDAGNNRLAGARVDDDAVIFVAKQLSARTGADAKVITGKALKNWTAAYGSASSALTNKSNSVNAVQVGALVDSGSNYGSEQGNYGVIVGDPTVQTINGTKYVALPTWTENATEETTFLVKGSNAGAYSKGSAFQYETDDTETVGDVTYTVIKSGSDFKVVGSTIGKEVAILSTEKSGSDLLADVVEAGQQATSANTKTYKIDKDTTVIYINDESGAQGGSLEDVEATESAADDYYVSNAWIVKNADNTLDLVVYDVANKLNTVDDLEVKGTTSVVSSISGDKVTLKANATVATLLADLDNVLTTTGTNAYVATAGTDKVGSITVVATDGTSHKLTIDCSTFTFTA